MTIHFNMKIILWTLLVLSFPFNWYMMRQGVGIYDNNSNKEWVGTPHYIYHGPCTSGRVICLVTSPIIIPIAGLCYIANTTMPENKEER